MKLRSLPSLRPSGPVLVFLIPGLVTALTDPASAQLRAGQTLNQVFYVGGGPGTSGGNDDGRGSIGCGGAFGADLSDRLNGGPGGPLDGDNPVIAARRELWRFCDNMTDNVFGSAGSWTSAIITPDRETEQNAGLAPAELFGQSSVAQSLGRWQLQTVALRVQQLRTAMRESRGSEGGASVLAGARSGPRRWPALRPLAASLVPVTSAQEEQARLFETSRLMGDIERLGLQSDQNVFGISGLGAFANARYHRLDADTTLDQLGSRTNGGGFTLGLDYRASSRLVVGGAFAYNRFNARFDGDAGESKTDDYGFMGFASYYLDERIYVDGLLRGSYMSVDQRKRTPTFDAGPAFPERASSPDAWTLSADLGVGADYALQHWVLNPYARLRIFHTDVGAFTETGGDGSLNLRVDEQKVNSVPITLGGSASYNWSTSLGVLAPYVRAQYLHEFNDQAVVVSGSLVALPEARFSIQPDATDRNYGQVGGGATLTLPRGLSGYVDYDALVGFEALVTHTVTAGVRLEL